MCQKIVQNLFSGWSILILTSAFCGCAKPIYDWGGYEKSLYTMYTKAGAYNMHEDIDRLSVEIEKTVSNEKLVPPGKLAHLGYLFYLSGDTSSAMRFFEAEKRAFPESEKLMGRMLEQVK